MKEATEAGHVPVKSFGDNTHPEYRPDIDGLRALAVLAVVAYHAFPAWVHGGLIGVDIFYVISGYLISTIILKGLRQGRFSYVDFYIRRIKRIFPALVLILTACLVFGWFVLYDREYQSLGKHVAAGAGFVANFVLWQESGYFATNSQFKELLHLWSLGVEEQFYLIWPVLLAVLWKKTHALLPLIVSLLLISFALNVSLISSQPSATFYLPATRFWELMIGALLAYTVLFKDELRQLVPNGLRAGWLADPQSWRTLREICAWTGLLLLVVALLVVNNRQLYPGVLALLPTLGAACLIAAGPACSPNQYLFSARPMVAIGLISYPLYLWHWPLFSYLAILGGPNSGHEIRVGIVLLSFVLAWLTYRLLERPIRSNRSRMPAAVLSALAIAVGATGLFIFEENGLKSRAVNTDNQEIRAFIAKSEHLEIELRSNKYPTTSCDDLAISAVAKQFCASYGPRVDDTIILWGDSQTWAWSPVFFAIAQEKRIRVIVFSIGGCPPLIMTRRINVVENVSNCPSFGNAENFVDAIKVLRPKRVFLIGFWSLYARPNAIEAARLITATDYASNKSVFESQLIETLRDLPTDIPVTIFRAAPVLRGDLDGGLLRKQRIEPTAEEYSLSEGEANRAIDGTLGTRENLTVFDPSSLLCARTCRVIVGGTLMYDDSVHISAQGALLYRDVLARDFFRF